LLVDIVAVVHFTVQWLAWTLIYPTLEASIKWPALLPNRIIWPLLSNLIIELEMIIKMSFQLFISDKSLATIRTLKLNSEENLIDSNDVLSINKKKRNKKEM
jgi:hypothetical protein